MQIKIDNQKFNINTIINILNHLFLIKSFSDRQNCGPLSETKTDGTPRFSSLIFADETVDFKGKTQGHLLK